MPTAAQTAESTSTPGLDEHVDKMMSHKLSQLKKLAKKKGITAETIQEVITSAGDEDDSKSVLISLMFKMACLKAAPSPVRTRTKESENEADLQTCTICPGCIRPPNHDGPCMDGQCNDIEPESPICETLPSAAVTIARHRTIKEEVRRKVEEETQQETASMKEATTEKVPQKATAEEEGSRKAPEQVTQQKIAAEKEVRRDVAEREAQQNCASQVEVRRKVAEQEVQQKAVADKFFAEAEANRKVAAAQMGGTYHQGTTYFNSDAGNCTDGTYYHGNVSNATGYSGINYVGNDHATLSYVGNGYNGATYNVHDYAHNGQGDGYGHWSGHLASGTTAMQSW